MSDVGYRALEESLAQCKRDLSAAQEQLRVAMEDAARATDRPTVEPASAPSPVPAADYEAKLDVLAGKPAAVSFGPERQDYPGGPIYRVGTSTGATAPEPSPPPAGPLPFPGKSLETPADKLLERAAEQLTKAACDDEGVDGDAAIALIREIEMYLYGPDVVGTAWSLGESDPAPSPQPAADTGCAAELPAGMPVPKRIVVENASGPIKVYLWDDGYVSALRAFALAEHERAERLHGSWEIESGLRAFQTERAMSAEAEMKYQTNRAEAAEAEAKLLREQVEGMRGRLNAMRLYVAAEGHNENGKFIGLAYRGYDQWGPTLRENYDPFEFAEEVEKWLHAQIDAALAAGGNDDR